MENKIAVLSIIIKDCSQIDRVNSILHDARDFVIGRFGLPYKSKAVNIITVIFDAPQDILSAVSGKLGMIEGVNSKVLVAK